MYADFWFYYHLDLGVAIAEGYPTVPMLLTLVDRLPADSAFGAARRGSQVWRDWGNTQELLAAVVDAVRENTFCRGNFKKPPSWEPVKRPGDWDVPGVKKEPRRVSLSEASSVLRKFTG